MIPPDRSSETVIIQQGKDIVNDLVLGLGLGLGLDEEVQPRNAVSRIRTRGFFRRNSVMMS